MTEFFNRKPTKKRRRYLRKTMPKAEAVLWKCLKGRQVLGCKFRRQYGVAEYSIDFYSPEVKLAIEVDGASHFHTTGKRRDQERDRFLERFEIRILKFLNTDVLENLDEVVEAIGREVERRRAEIRNRKGLQARGS
jgi:very-short-patch-repair endonuclease